MSDITESHVRARLARVNDLIAKHRLDIALLEKERADLDAAVSVIDRLRKQLADDQTLKFSFVEPKHEPTLEPKRPTIPAMIMEALDEANILSLPGLEPKAILAFIKDRYWPDAEQQSVGPVAWRMAREGRIKKVGRRYYLLSDETPADDAAGVSEPEDEDGTL